MPYAFNPLSGKFDFYTESVTPGGISGQIQFNNGGVFAGVSTTSVDGSGNLTFTARWIQSTNGAASAPPMSLSGMWFTGGTSTTTKPQFLIEPAGTTSNNWGTAGTGLGVNAPSGFPGNLLDLQVNGTPQVRISSTGAIAFQPVTSNSLISPTAFANALLLQTDIEPLYVLPSGSSQGSPKFSFCHISNAGRTPGFNISSDHSVNWNSGTDISTGSADLRLFRDAPNTLAQRNGTAAQASRIYNTFTDASNYERLALKWNSNAFQIEPEAAGTGVVRPLQFPANGIASTPPVSLTGTWFTGGLASTTKPQFLIEPAGTTSTSWSTAGTGLGVNAPSGFTGNLLDLQVNGSSRFSVDSANSIAFVNTIRKSRAEPGGEVNVAGVALSPFICGIQGSGVFGITSGGNPSTPDTLLGRDASGIFAQRNGTNAQTFRVYNTSTSATNYEFGKLEWSGNVFRIGTEKGSGGGTARAMELQTDGTTRLTLAADGSTITVASGTNLVADHRLTGSAPASATATGTSGDVRSDADYIYICTATNTWKRAAITTW